MFIGHFNNFQFKLLKNDLDTVCYRRKCDRCMHADIYFYQQIGCQYQLLISDLYFVYRQPTLERDTPNAKISRWDGKIPIMASPMP